MTSRNQAENRENMTDDEKTALAETERLGGVEGDGGENDSASHDKAADDLRKEHQRIESEAGGKKP